MTPRRVLFLTLAALALGSSAAAAAPTFTGTPDAVTRNTVATFTFGDGGAASFRCALDGATATACTSPRTVRDLADGEHTFTVTSISFVGAPSGEATHRWRVDTVAPTLTLRAAPADGFVTPSGTVTLAFASDDAGAEFDCRVDDAAWTACASPAELTAAQAGEHRVAVRARDAAGNESAAVERRFVTSPLAAPPGAPDDPVRPVRDGSPCADLRAAAALGSVVGDGCRLGALVIAPDVTLAPLYAAEVAVSGLIAREGALGASRGAYTAAWRRALAARDALGRGAVCRGATTMRRATAELAAARTTLAGELAAMARADATGASGDFDEADRRAADRAYVDARAGSLGAEAGAMADAMTAACRSLKPKPVLRTAQVRAVQRGTLTLADGSRWLLPAGARVGRIAPGTRVRLSGNAGAKGKVGVATSVQPAAPSSAGAGAAVAGCMTPQIIPVQPDVPAPIRHELKNYLTRDGSHLLIEDGMRIGVRKGAGCPGGMQLGVRVRIIRADMNETIASWLTPADTKTPIFPGRYWSGGVARPITKLTFEVLGRTCVNCAPVPVRTDSWKVISAPTGGFAHALLQRSAFAADHTEVDEANMVLAAINTLKLDTGEDFAGDYAFHGRAWTGPASNGDVTSGQAFLMRPAKWYAGWAPFTAASVGSGPSRTNVTASWIGAARHGGLAWPHIKGTTRAFRFAVRLPNIVTDLVSSDCTPMPSLSRACGYTLPWARGTTGLVSQGNGPGFSHNGAQLYAYDMVLKDGEDMYATRGGQVWDLVEWQTMQLWPDACKNRPKDYTGPNDGQANYLRIDHQDGTYSYYAHMQAESIIPLANGMMVFRGDPVAKTGTTGRSCGPHLHYQVASVNDATIYGQTTDIGFRVSKDGTAINQYNPAKGEVLGSID